MAAGASFSATATGQKDVVAGVAGNAAPNCRGGAEGCVFLVRGGAGRGARNSSMCSTFQLAMPISSIVFPSASFMNMFGGAPCVYVTCTFG